MIVCKFGGTSVADAAAIARLVEIVRGRSAERPVVVVSALAGVTDALLGLAEPVHAGDGDGARRGGGRPAPAARDHRAVARRRRGRAGADSRRRPRRCGARSGPPWAGGSAAAEARPPRGRGRAVELAARRRGAGRVRGCRRRGWTSGPSWSPTTASAGPRRTPRCSTPGRGNACCRWPRPGRCRSPRVSSAPPPTGTPDHARPGRLGLQRGAARGRGVGASRVEIWTDVGGLMTADPRIVPERADPGGGELRGGRGAGDLRRQDPPSRHRDAAGAGGHPDRGAQLAAARARRAPPSSLRRSWSGWAIPRSDRFPGSSGITVVNIRAPRMLGTYGFLRALFEVFERHEMVVDVLASGEVSVSLTIEDRSRLDPVVRELADLGEVWVEEQPGHRRGGGDRAPPHARAWRRGSSARSSRPTWRSSPRAPRRST